MAQQLRDRAELPAGSEPGDERGAENGRHQPLDEQRCQPLSQSVGAREKGHRLCVVADRERETGAG